MQGAPSVCVYLKNKSPLFFIIFIIILEVLYLAAQGVEIHLSNDSWCLSKNHIILCLIFYQINGGGEIQTREH